jgi:hypothetical protein
MKKSIKAGIFFVTLLAAPILLTSLAIDIRTSDHDGFTRIVFEADRAFTYAVQNRPGQLQVRVSGRADFPARTLAWPDSPLLERLTYEIQGSESVFTVLLKGDVTVKKSFVLEKPFRVVFDLGKSSTPAGTGSPEKKADPPQAQESPPPAPSRPKPIETICIDPTAARTWEPDGQAQERTSPCRSAQAEG